MSKTVPLDASTLAWARHIFGRYYQGSDVPPPNRVSRREFAAFPFSEQTMMRRHAAFRNAEELQEFLRREAPRHVYYSSAYYRHPADARMDGKEWLGADLIFDLDSDHLRGAAELDYVGQLVLVKDRLLRLIDDFLVSDFGIDPAQMTLVFSGGRGYHVHIRHAAFVDLVSPERRELVEYVLGSGFDPMTAVEGHREEGETVYDLPSSDGPSGGARRARSGRAYRTLPPPDASGWRGRTTRAVFRLLERWEAIGVDAATVELERLGVPHEKARRWARLLVKDGGGARIRQSLSLDVFKQELPVEFLEVILPQAAIELQGETDAPVTTDIHRLIRLPGSLHGGTGFRVVPLSREALERFEPLRDALLPAPPGERVTVELLAPVHYPFDPQPIDAAAGTSMSVPSAQALFLVLRGEAALPSAQG